MNYIHSNKMFIYKHIDTSAGKWAFTRSDPTGLSDWSVRRSYRVNASSDRRTDGRRIKHV